MDSLSLVELRNTLNVSFGLELSATVLFDFPTMADLATHIFELLKSRSVPMAFTKVQAEAKTGDLKKGHGNILQHVTHIVEGVIGPLESNQVCLFP